MVDYEWPVRKLYTMRFDPVLVELFGRVCKAKGMSVARGLEELMATASGDDGTRKRAERFAQNLAEDQALRLDCAHPKDSENRFSHGTYCGVCGHKLS